MCSRSLATSSLRATTCACSGTLFPLVDACERTESSVCSLWLVPAGEAKGWSADSPGEVRGGTKGLLDGLCIGGVVRVEGEEVTALFFVLENGEEAMGVLSADSCDVYGKGRGISFPIATWFEQKRDPRGASAESCGSEPLRCPSLRLGSGSGFWCQPALPPRDVKRAHANFRYRVTPRMRKSSPTTLPITAGITVERGGTAIPDSGAVWGVLGLGDGDVGAYVPVVDR